MKSFGNWLKSTVAFFLGKIYYKSLSQRAKTVKFWSFYPNPFGGGHNSQATPEGG